MVSSTPAKPVSSPSSSALYRLVELALKEPLADYLLARREEGQGFAQIAFTLYGKTGVSMTHEAVRRWVRDIEQLRGITPSVLPGHEHHSATEPEESVA